jgi:hypothetical protein
MNTEFTTREDQTIVLFRQGHGTKIHRGGCGVAYGPRTGTKRTNVAIVVIPAGSTLAEKDALIANELHANNINPDRVCTKCYYYN